MTALANALARAQSGLDWSYPCLIWVADYLRDATGQDPAAAWRAVEWSEARARQSLAKLALGGTGKTAVEKALDRRARDLGWIERDAPMQGAVMVGVFTSADGVGVPAIFDGQSRWIVSHDGQGWVSTVQKPERIWEVRHG